MKHRGALPARLLAIVMALALVAAACSDDDTDASRPAADTAAVTEQPEPEPEPAAPDASDASMATTQMAAVEEQPILLDITSAAGSSGLDITFGEEGPFLDQILAGAGQIDVLGALHGSFPPLARENALTNLADLLDDLSADRSFAPSMVSAGLLGTADNLAFVPWAQATYIMAANRQALDYVPAGVDIDNMTWDDLADWCQALLDGEGRPLCGLPRAGLFHRFLEGYMWPSYTGGMVSQFRSDGAEAMMAFLRDDLSPTLNPEGINWDFMQEPLLSGEAWVAFDHVARLIEAFETEPETFAAFPTPSGPVGRGFMPVIVGLGIPADAPNPEAAAAAIEYLTRPDVQSQVLAQLAFFPVVEGVDTSSLPEGVAIEAEAVEKLLNAPDGIPALLPVGLGERGGEINQIFRNAFDRIVDGGEDIATVLDEEGDALQALMNETGAPCWDPDPAGDGPCVVEPAG
ncbi:extracellular solute-binding protein [Candidatus Poriferisodalis sp.]|uniref:extracellular solute-binding protein n=1 Tax=Candidatus Poriferisodalis sp. TaxID=3101277 RepID=UPI003B02873C